jgi:hypothetical protein
MEAIVDGRIGTVRDRTVPPARADPEHVDDPGDHPPIIHTPCPAPSFRQKRLDPRPFRIAQPGQRLADQRLRFRENLEAAQITSRKLIEFRA